MTYMRIMLCHGPSACNSPPCLCASAYKANLIPWSMLLVFNEIDLEMGTDPASNTV